MKFGDVAHDTFLWNIPRKAEFPEIVWRLIAVAVLKKGRKKKKECIAVGATVTQNDCPAALTENPRHNRGKGFTVRRPFPSTDIFAGRFRFGHNFRALFFLNYYFCSIGLTANCS